MRRFSLPVFLILVLISMPWMGKTQDFESAYVYLLKKELRVLPYRALTVDYSLSFDSLRERYVFNAPQLYMDSILEGSISQKLNELTRETAFSYKGTIDFDSYTSQIFIRSEKEGSAWLVDLVCVAAYPQDATEHFWNRWKLFLDTRRSAAGWGDKLGVTDATVGMIIDVDGSLVVRDKTKLGVLFREFLQKEQRWKPGVINGRPIPQRLDMLLLSSHFKYRRHNGLPWRLNLGEDEEIVYFDTDLPDGERIRMVLSMVCNNGRYEAPIFHKGAMNELQPLLTVLGNHKTDLLYFGPYAAERVYFYVLNH